MSKHPRPPYINHIDYIQSWRLALERVTAQSPNVPPPPEAYVRHFGAPHCPKCWDTGLCSECCGLYPQYCPADCSEGTCDCAAGKTRLADYLASFARAGLPAPEIHR